MLNRLNEHEIFEFDAFDCTINEVKLNQIKTILRDMYVKYNTKKQKTKENIEIEKLLKARENNLDFDKELSEMICGDNPKFPYRSSKYLTDFFQKLQATLYLFKLLLSLRSQNKTARITNIY